ncbi:hypothetical protein M758_UG025200 [Ceratodon purpureus]|nr:hypothetical protein M758_UG025200 [Ceratodon purpureus]
MTISYCKIIFTEGDPFWNNKGNKRFMSTAVLYEIDALKICMIHFIHSSIAYVFYLHEEKRCSDRTSIAVDEVQRLRDHEVRVTDGRIRKRIQTVGHSEYRELKGNHSHRLGILKSMLSHS